MNISLKIALMMIASPLAIQAGVASFAPNIQAVQALDEDGHGDEHSEKSGEHGEENAIKMTAAERRKAGVQVDRVGARALIETVSAPGEVTANFYATTMVTPRISAQVVGRHVRMGDRVKVGQKLVTLSSVDMAEAQGNLILAEQEWRRTQRLGRDVVSEQRYLEAKIGGQLARAKAIAFGMTDSQLTDLLKSDNAAAGTGEFDLVATQAGTVISDDFIVGQFVEPGQILFAVSDESRVWVEAKVDPEKALTAKPGSEVWIIDDGNRVAGTVVQVHHTVDEETRTLAVRIEVDNSADLLHAGEFVTVEIKTGESSAVLAVPDQSIVLLEGSTIVFKREGNELHPTKVQTGASKGGWTQIISGLSSGEEIVTRQAFLIKSLILKSKMGEGHGH